MNPDLARVKRVRARRERADQDWSESIRAAAETNSLRAVARVAGISHVRVLKITRGE